MLERERERPGKRWRRRSKDREKAFNEAQKELSFIDFCLYTAAAAAAAVAIAASERGREWVSR